MKKCIIVGTVGMLIMAMPCNARKSYRELQREKSELHAQNVELHIQKRKNAERYNAARIVQQAKTLTARKKQDCERKREQSANNAAALTNLNYQKDRECAYRNEVRHYTALIKDLSSPAYTERPILDLVHEAEFSLQTIASYNKKGLNRLQAQLERALRDGKHSASKHDRSALSNTELITRESAQTLLAHTHNAQQMVEDIATQAEEITHNLTRTIQEQRAIIATLSEQINTQIKASQEQVLQLTKLNDRLIKKDADVKSKETQALNIAQCVDTSNAVTTTSSSNRPNNAEEIIDALEKKAYKAEQKTFQLMLRLHAAERSLRDVESGIATRMDR
jgi:hypothetical protein